jgi:electron transport complex protein RnfG
MAGADGGPIRTLVLVALVAAGAAFIVNTSHEFSKVRIAANQRARLVARLNSVLDPTLRSRDLATVRLSVTDDLLGSAEPIDVFVASEAGRPVAAVFASVAPHGYNADIHLLIGVSPAATVTGVRAVSHRETAGLGDGIDIAKTAWITQFDGKGLQTPPPELWAVDKDDGQFDSLTGATVTSRAVVRAVKDTLLYFEQHRDELYAAAAAAAVSAKDATAE